jgi:hypothetical protein
MLDIELLVQQLRLRGHTIDSVTPSEETEGDYCFVIDGMVLNLSDVFAQPSQTIH